MFRELFLLSFLTLITNGKRLRQPLSTSTAHHSVSETIATFLGSGNDHHHTLFHAVIQVANTDVLCNTFIQYSVLHYDTIVRSSTTSGKGAACKNGGAWVGDGMCTGLAACGEVTSLGDDTACLAVTSTTCIYTRKENCDDDGGYEWRPFSHRKRLGTMIANVCTPVTPATATCSATDISSANDVVTCGQVTSLGDDAACLSADVCTYSVDNFEVVLMSQAGDPIYEIKWGVLHSGANPPMFEGYCWPNGQFGGECQVNPDDSTISDCFKAEVDTVVMHYADDCTESVSPSASDTDKEACLAADDEDACVVIATAAAENTLACTYEKECSLIEPVTPQSFSSFGSKLLRTTVFSKNNFAAGDDFHRIHTSAFHQIMIEDSMFCQPDERLDETITGTVVSYACECCCSDQTLSLSATGKCLESTKNNKRSPIDVCVAATCGVEGVSGSECSDCSSDTGYSGARQWLANGQGCAWGTCSTCVAGWKMNVVGNSCTECGNGGAGYICDTGSYKFGTECDGTGTVDTQTCFECVDGGAGYNCGGGTWSSGTQCDGTGTADTQTCSECINGGATYTCVPGSRQSGTACTGTLFDTQTCAVCGSGGVTYACAPGSYKSGTVCGGTGTADTQTCAECGNGGETYACAAGSHKSGTVCDGTGTSDTQTCAACGSGGTTYACAAGSYKSGTVCDGTGTSDTQTCGVESKMYGIVKRKNTDGICVFECSWWTGAMTNRFDTDDATLNLNRVADNAAVCVAMGFTTPYIKAALTSVEC